jgi:hypothetical protein
MVLSAMGICKPVDRFEEARHLLREVSRELH